MSAYKQAGNKTLGGINRANRAAHGQAQDAEELSGSERTRLQQRVKVINESLTKGHIASTQHSLEEEKRVIENILTGKLKYTGQV
jgi:hypothetical protein